MLLYGRGIMNLQSVLCKVSANSNNLLELIGPYKRNTGYDMSVILVRM